MMGGWDRAACSPNTTHQPNTTRHRAAPQQEEEEPAQPQEVSTAAENGPQQTQLAKGASQPHHSTHHHTGLAQRVSARVQRWCWEVGVLSRRSLLDLWRNPVLFLSHLGATTYFAGACLFGFVEKCGPVGGLSRHHLPLTLMMIQHTNQPNKTVVLGLVYFDLSMSNLQAVQVRKGRPKMHAKRQRLTNRPTTYRTSPTEPAGRFPPLLRLPLLHLRLGAAGTCIWAVQF